MKARKRILSLLLSIVMLFGLLPNTRLLQTTASAAEYLTIVSRDDGVWYWPLTESHYYNSCSDWAGCNSNGSSGICPFHGYHCYNCGANHTTSNGYGHNGMDVGAAGNTNVYAMANGTLYCVNTNHSSRGYTVVLEHPTGTTSDGTAWSYYSFYQHLAGVNTTLNGKFVTAGTVIAQTGNSDGTSSGGAYHLHFGILMGKSGRGSQMAQNPNSSTSGLSYLQNFGWIKEPGFREGMIIVNPADNIPMVDGTSDSLRAHPGSVHYTFDTSKVSIGEGYSSNSYLTQCTFYRSYQTVTANKASKIKTLPCSVSTDTSSEDIRSMVVGETLTVTGLYLNTVGNYWYRVALNGQDGYVYAGDVIEDKALVGATISEVSAPVSLNVGDRFSIKGVISSEKTDLLQVTAYIAKGEETVMQSYDGLSDGQNSYSLLNSSIDLGLAFNTLEAGWYKYVVYVKEDTYTKVFFNNTIYCGYIALSLTIYRVSFSIFKRLLIGLSDK